MKCVWRKLCTFDFCEGDASDEGNESEGEDQQQVAFSRGLVALAHVAWGGAIAFDGHGCVLMGARMALD